MKPVFKCDYCKFMGTEDEVKEHEPTCIDNYDRKNCYTCTHRKIKTMTQWECSCGKKLPEGHIFEFCDKHERKEKSNCDLNSTFGSLFGWGVI